MNKREKDFVKTVWDFYHTHKRQLPWRNTYNPYRVLVSEIMLQQTQVDRVIPKYKSWIKKFPSTKALAEASRSNVLKEWQGLGYNRRALNLKRAAEEIMLQHDGKFPQSYDELQKLPGIGPYTAGAISAFAWNNAEPIIETNIRTVFLHHFFRKKSDVLDSDIVKLITKTLDQDNPREWYWALMDYGSFLKKTHGNNTKQSKHYVKQSPFKGSKREVRSLILQDILAHPHTTVLQISKRINKDKNVMKEIILQMISEGLITKSKRGFVV